DDDACHRIGERDVGADVNAQPDVAPHRGCGATRVDDVQRCAVLDALEKMMKPDRMRFTGVRTPEENEVSVLRFLVRARRTTGAKDGRQTDDRRRVSGPIATVDVVVAEDLSRHL